MRRSGSLRARPRQQKRTIRRGEACRRWVWAGVEAARRAEMAVRMDLDPVSQTPVTWRDWSSRPACPPGQRSGEVAAEQLGRPPGDAEAQALFAKAGNERSRTRPSARTPAIRTADSLRAFFPVSPRDRLARWPGTAAPAAGTPAGAVQEERERVPLRGGERGCCLGQFPDPGVRAAGGVVCGVPVGVVAARRARSGRPGRGCPAGLWSRFRFRAAALIPWHGMIEG